MPQTILRTSLLALLLLTSACSSLQPQPQGRQLSGTEIEALLSGYTFTLIGMKSGNALLVYADTEHCTMRYVNGTRTKQLRWYIEGDLHCCMRNGEPACGPIYEQGEGLYYKFTAGRHSHTLKEFTTGNRL